jgi:hypothetical protein
MGQPPLSLMLYTGHGATGGEKMSALKRGEFLHALLGTLGVLGQPLAIVTPSMSGCVRSACSVSIPLADVYAHTLFYPLNSGVMPSVKCRTYILPYLSSHITALAAWVAVAPAGLKEWGEGGTAAAMPSTQRDALKVLAVYGEGDTMRKDYGLIEDAFPKAQLVLIKGERVACLCARCVGVAWFGGVRAINWMTAAWP